MSVLVTNKMGGNKVVARGTKAKKS
jgi:hypothetical protein